jgi:hypothetical protein
MGNPIVSGLPRKVADMHLTGNRHYNLGEQIGRTPVRLPGLVPDVQPTSIEATLLSFDDHIKEETSDVLTSSHH